MTEILLKLLEMDIPTNTLQLFEETLFFPDVTKLQKLFLSFLFLYVYQMKCHIIFFLPFYTSFLTNSFGFC